MGKARDDGIPIYNLLWRSVFLMLEANLKVFAHGLGIRIEVVRKKKNQELFLSFALAMAPLNE